MWIEGFLGSSNRSIVSMLASMVKPQAQIRAKPRETMRPTQRPMDMSSPHSHIGPNLPRFTSNTCILQLGNLSEPEMTWEELDLNTPSEQAKLRPMGHSTLSPS